MHVSVTLITGEKLDFHVKGDSCTIGRSPKCEIQIPHEGISRQHCRIDNENGKVFVTDLNSTNGVLIDGQKIGPDKKVEFQTFLPLSFGPVQSLLVELDESSPGPEATGTKSLSSMYGVSGSVSSTDATTITRPLKQPTASAKAPHRASPPPLMPKDEGKSFDFKMILMNLLALALLGGAIYWYMMHDSDAPVHQGKKSEVIEYY